jgi:antitoxin VapB
MTTSTAKLFRNGGSQAVRLPSEFRFEGVEEVRIWRDPVTGDVVLSPRKMSVKEFIEFRNSLGPLSADEIAVLKYRDQGVDEDRDLFADEDRT